jgi:hypothetical protein
MRRLPRIPLNRTTAFASLFALAVVLVVSAVVLVVLIGLGGQTERGQRNSDRVKEVAHAILKYRSDRAAFPADLQALVPSYLPRLPALEGDGVRWSYLPVPDQGAFRLACVHDGDEWTCNYFTENDTVLCDTK